MVQKGITNVKLILHLQTDLKKIFPDLKKTINHLEQEEKLEIINRTIQRPGLYHMGDVYVYPSRLDGIGLTIAEAISCGLPIIVPDTPPMNEFALSKGSELVKISRLYSRYDGYYWPQCHIDVHDLSAKMEQFVFHSDRLRQFSQNARKYALEKLNWRKNSIDLTEILFNGEPLDFKKELSDRATKFDNRRYPGLTKNPWFYSLLAHVKRGLEK